MKDTRENILLVSLRLFAKNGYEAVSVSQIAGELGLTKGALYRHYANKQAIFESILEKMERMDAQRARDFDVPEGTAQDMPQDYELTTPRALCAFAKAQFRYWAEDDFAAPFRKMLTVEQYRSEEMAALYQQYLAGGPLGYVCDLLEAMGFADARGEAIAFYAPLLAMLAVYDGAENKRAIVQDVDVFYDNWLKRIEKRE